MWLSYYDASNFGIFVLDFRLGLDNGLMARLILCLCATASIVATLLTTAYVVLYSAPLHFGLLFADAPDPARPGHMKGVTVSTPEFMGHVALLIALGTTTVVCVKSTFAPRDSHSTDPSTSARG